MEWIQVLTFIGVNIVLFSVLLAFLLRHANKVDEDIKECRNVDTDFKLRLSQLYTMFCDLLKEQRK